MSVAINLVDTRTTVGEMAQVESLLSEDTRSVFIGKHSELC